MVPRENKNNAYAKFGGTNKEYYGIFQNGLLQGSGLCQPVDERIIRKIDALVNEGVKDTC